MPHHHVVTWDDHTPTSIDIICGYCGIGVAANRISQSIELKRWDEPPGYGVIGVVVGTTYLCPRAECRGPSLVFQQFRNELGETYGGEILTQLPRAKTSPIEGLSEEIAADRIEAWSCFHGGSFRASVIMGRAAIQRAVRSLEAEGAGLKAEIASLREKGVITEALKEWADEVRIAGDEAAHPATLGGMTQAEAEASLEFMDAFLDHAIALPARRAARKAARQA